MTTAVQTSETRTPVQAAPAGNADHDALLTSWLHGRSPHSTRAYQANIARFLAQARKPLTAVTLVDLQGYADSLADAGLAPASQARMLAAVKSLLTFAHTTGYLPYRGRLTKRKLLYAKAEPSHMSLQYLGNHAVTLRTHGPVAYCVCILRPQRSVPWERDHDA